MCISYLTAPNVFLSVLVGAVLWLVTRYGNSKRRYLYHHAGKVNGPPVFPIIGSSYVFWGGTKNILETFVRLMEKYRSICKLWLGSKLMFVVSKPEYLQVILNRSLEKEEGYRFIRPVFGYGLFTRPVRDWRGHRKVIVSTFRQHILNSFIDIFNQYSNEFVHKLRPTVDRGEYMDAFPVITQCTLDIMCSSVMGTEMNAMKEESQFIIWMTKVAELSIIRMFNVYLWPEMFWKMTSIARESEDLDRKIQNYVSTVIESKRNLRTVENGGKKIFLDHLLDLVEKDEAWNIEDVTHETRSVIMAGSDATAITLSYCLVMLAMFQDVQDRVYEEIHSIFGNSDRDIEAEDLGKLQYLERFIKETLRVFPVSSYIGRELTEDVVCGEHLLPKGSSIGIPIFYIHRSEKFWTDPLKFEPDRFLPEEIGKIHPCTYMPFSYGPRNCIGFKYAYMVMKVVLCTLLRHYRVAETSYKGIADMKVKMDIATKCDEGYPVRLEVRMA